MIKYLYFLLTFSLLGCSSEPSLPEPIKPTENKTKTIQKWIDYFEPHLMVYLLQKIQKVVNYYIILYYIILKPIQ